jgi:hypothetical protein
VNTNQNVAIKVLKFCNTKELSEILLERNSLLSCTKAGYVVKYEATIMIENKSLLGLNDLWV